MNELENKYLYIINNILQGYDRDIVINHVAELEADLNFALNMSKKRGDEILQLEKEKSELIESENHYKKCYLSELADKSELIEIAREYMELLLSYELHDFWNDCDINEGERIKELLKKHGVEI